MLWTPRLNALGEKFDLSETISLQVISWNHQDPLPDNAPHRHTYFEICTVGAHGEGEFRLENAVYPIGRGDTFFARPGEVHQIVNTLEPPMELFWVSFSLVAKNERSRDFPSSSIALAHDDTISAVWNSLRVAAQSLASESVLRALANALLESILGAGGSENVQEEPIPLSDARAHSARLALRYIHDNLAKKMSLPEIAAHIHVSPRQLVRLFALFVGAAPAQYIERARLDRSETLLLRSQKPIKEIAREVGFEDVAHFSRVFAKRSGNPPGDFRKRNGPLIERPSGPNIQKFGDLV